MDKKNKTSAYVIG